MKSRVFIIFSLLALVVALCAASVASAQDVTPGGDVYVKDFVQGDGNTDVREDDGDTDDDVVATVDCASGADINPTTGQPCNVATISSGDLPFTGFEAGLVGLAGIALVGAGIGMRRLTRNSAS